MTDKEGDNENIISLFFVDPMLKTSPQNTPNRSRRRCVFFLLLSLILLIYSNTFNAAWHLDDYSNITRESSLHFNELQPASIFETFKLSGNGVDLYRPAARLTFALNWYWGQDRVFGYHAVNIGIHFLTAWMLYLTVIRLLLTPRLSHCSKQQAEFIAFLATVLWAVNPIQTQAVTYIVQRMATMATLFYVSALYCYLVARSAHVLKKRAFWLLGTLLSFALALASKENAITLPIAILFIEVLFFQNLDNPTVKKRLIKWCLATGVFFLVCGALMANLWMADPLAYLQNLYAQRDFTLWERLLTQPRVVVFYLSQIFYPIPSRLSITHDIAVSSSLLAPWTTLPCLVLIVVLFGCGLALAKRHPLIAFGLLFFFLNHLIESTVLPLEMVFEHRNYLPSLFLFVPIAAGLQFALTYYRSENKGMYRIIATFVTLLVLGQGMGTYIRNFAWVTEKSLWEDAIAKAPQSARPYISLAYGYYQPSGQFDMALKYYRLGLARDPFSKRRKHIVFNNIGNIYFATGAYESAAQMFEQALKIKPESQLVAMRYVQALIKIGKIEQAWFYIDGLSPALQNLSTFLNYKGYLLLKQGKTGEAIACLRQSLNVDPQKSETLLFLGLALETVGSVRQGAWFYKRSLAAAVGSPVPLFYLIANAVNSGDEQAASGYLKRLFGSFNLMSIRSSLSNMDRDHDNWAVLHSLRPAIAAEIERLGPSFTGNLKAANGR